LAVNTADVATPCVFVTAVFAPPANVPLAPVPGTANVTVTPLTGFPPEPVTVTTSVAPNAVFTTALCGVPLVATIEAATLGLLTVAVAEAELFPVSGSGKSEVTLAPFTIVPLAAAPTRTITVTVALPAFTRVPRLHVTVAVPLQAAPWEGVADTRVAFAGKVSVTVTFVAVFGPAFVTVSV
jgi:hypothetical protein